MRAHFKNVFYNKAGVIALFDEGFGRCTVKKRVDIAA